MRESCGHHYGRIDDRLGHANGHLRERIFGGCGEHVTTQNELRFTGRDARRVQHFLSRRNADVAHHRAVFLRQTRHVKNSEALTFEEGSHAEHLTNR